MLQIHFAYKTLWYQRPKCKKVPENQNEWYIAFLDFTKLAALELKMLQ